jgi:hypothetical protein
MSIRIVCPGCQKGITAPDKYAGKSAKCPGCGSEISIPAAKPIADVPKAEPLIPPPPPPRPAVQLVTRDTMDCPYCGEQIKATARKCRFCNEYLDEELRSEEIRRSGSYNQINVTTQPPSLPGIGMKPLPKTQTVEATAKRWKLLQLIGGLGILVSVMLIIGGIASGDGDPSSTMPAVASGSIVLLLSLPAWIAGRFFAWWFHG